MINKINIQFGIDENYYITYFSNNIVYYNIVISTVYKERFINNKLFGFNIKIKTK